jgi:hypothetical protein
MAGSRHSAHTWPIAGPRADCELGPYDGDGTLPLSRRIAQQALVAIALIHLGPPGSVHADVAARVACGEVMAVGRVVPTTPFLSASDG